MDDHDDIYDEMWSEDMNDCHYCDGDGWGIVGVDWDSKDPLWGPRDGDIEECPCCHGSGKAEDCTFW